MAIKTIKIALDWTPNTIHSGLFMAYHKGYYKEAGLNVEFISPATDNYELTPARRLAQKKVDFAIAPSESVISYNTSRNPEPLISVAGILQRDTSAIVALKSSGIKRPAELDGRTYASYDARFEDGIVAEMIKNDGGKGEFTPVTIGRLGIWDMLKKGEADSTWVFMPWEGVQAERNGIELNVFRMEDFGIPYGYTPLILAHGDTLEANHQDYRHFLMATALAYKEAAEDPETAAEFLCEHVDHPDFKDKSFIAASLKQLKPALLTENGDWGLMEEKVWDKFITFLTETNLLEPDKAVNGRELFTNELLNPDYSPRIFFADKAKVKK